MVKVTQNGSSEALFSANFSATRKLRSLSQEAVAEAMQERGFDFHQQTVYKIEKRQRKVTLSEAIALAEVLDLPLESLTNPTRSPEEERLFTLLSVAKSLADVTDELSVTAQRLESIRQAVLGEAKRLSEFAESVPGLASDLSEMLELIEALGGLSIGAQVREEWKNLSENPATASALRTLRESPQTLFEKGREAMRSRLAEMPEREG